MPIEINKGNTPVPPSGGAVDSRMLTVDTKGRTLKVRQLKAIDRMRLFGFIDNQMADKDRWLSYAFLASCCAAINGEEVMLPMNVKEIEFLVQRLDDEGLAAIAVKLGELNASEEAGGLDASKKSAATQA